MMMISHDGILFHWRPWIRVYKQKKAVRDVYDKTTATMMMMMMVMT